MSPLETESRRIRRTSSGSVILRHVDGEWHALLLRAWSHWDFPKGNVELGETLMEAAVREVNEETGIADLAFPWGAAFARTPVYSRDKVAYYSIATTSTAAVVLAPNPETGLKEHDEFRWVPWPQVQTLLSPRLSGILEWVESVAKLSPASQAAPRAEETQPPSAALPASDLAPAQPQGADKRPRRGIYGRERRK